MQLIINIPKEFEKDFNSDKFKDCLTRVLMDCKGLNYKGLTGRYEHETLEMFIKAFENAKFDLTKTEPTYSGKDIEKAIGSMKTVMGWIPVSERLPETDNKNEINNYNVLLWVKNKNYPEREPQIYLGKLRYINGDDGSGNFWGIKTKPCNWTIWGWCYFNEPDVLAWMPLPLSYVESEVEK